MGHFLGCRPASRGTRLRLRDDIGQQQALVVASGLCQRGRQTLGGQCAGEHVIGDRLTVDEDAVAVEDDQL
ncbi:MAG: hypothetical protein ABSH36_07595 [Solirubrobacteraceae bacterium]